MWTKALSLNLPHGPLPQLVVSYTSHNALLETDVNLLHSAVDYRDR